MKTDAHESTIASDGKLFALLTACFYGLFTLLPDSHSLMVAWSWVFLWQIGLLCPVLWLLLLLYQRRIRALGNGWDWLMALIVVGVGISSIGAEFPQQARWYGWGVLDAIAAVYALHSWLNTPYRRYRLLVGQGYLSLAFIVISLFLWITQTLLPELSRLEALKQYGVNLSFDFSVLELRNWAPIGHQNYVAGYLLLSLPLLLCLSLSPTRSRRWLWGTGAILGLLDLYTTSSRGGWLGIVVVCLVTVCVLLFRRDFPRLWLILGGLGTFFGLALLILANNRLRTLIGAVLSGKGGGEFAYRGINAVTGWRMGLSHLWTGIGLGGVPLHYQAYRPGWAGRQSELAYQLHSTPVQLWAEMGIWGILSLVGAIALFGYCAWQHLRRDRSLLGMDRLFCWGIYASFLGYGVMSLTDYQLDNLSISGGLILLFVCLTSLSTPESQQANPPYFPKLSLLGIGIVVAIMIWLAPIHRAWQLSSQAFTALANEDLDSFVADLTKAQELAPWEPYYPHQLGWNLGDLALKSRDKAQRNQLLSVAIAKFEQGNTISPYQEFGHSNLGWLLLNTNPKAAMIAFAHSAALIPAKRGVFYGLGLSLLAQKKGDLGIEAFALEGLRDPLWITSPLWRAPGVTSIYSQVIDRMLEKYTQLLQQNPNDPYFHRCRGGLLWWKGDLEAAKTDLNQYGTPLAKLMLDLAQNPKQEPELTDIPLSAAKVIQAWFNPSQRSTLIPQAWVIATKTIIAPETEEQILAGMAKSGNFEQWLRENAPISQYRRERSGFGVLSRHIDGAIPKDFLVAIDNSAMNHWFAELLPVSFYNPPLDISLQPQRDALLEAISSFSE